MKYLKAINIWDAGTHSALINGQLKLQVGQWLRLGNNDPQLSRFISVKNGIINAVHYPNASGKVFKIRAKFHKADRENWSTEQRKVLYKSYVNGEL